MKQVRIATRASLLAMWQANHIRDLLIAQYPELTVEIVKTTTSGDRIQSIALSEFGGMGAFTREVQTALLEHQADIAVHSLKDLPTETHPHLLLAAVPARAPRHDSLILKASLRETLDPASSEPVLMQIPAGKRIGTGSIRRRAMLKAIRPDLEYLEIRGNVDTRLKKLDEGEYDAIILAEAGLSRLEYTQRERFDLLPPVMWPAVGQGALGIECRKEDRATQELLSVLDDPQTRGEVTAERALLKQLEAGCHAPVGVWSESTAEQLTLTAKVISPDGTQSLESTKSAEWSKSESLGISMAEQLITEGADQLIAED